MSLPSEFPRGISGRRIRAVAAGRLLILACVVALVTIVVPTALHESVAMLRTAQAALALSFGLSLSQLLLRRSGQLLRGLAMAQLVVDQLVISILVYLTGGVASGATSLYGLSCLAAGLMFGVSGAIVAGVGGGVAFSLTALLEQTRALFPSHPALFEKTQGTDQTTFYIVVNMLVLALVALLVSYLAERVARTSGELIEARRRAEQAERMAGMGRLAAGLAHEIRNPLSSISGSVQLLRAGRDDPEDRMLCEIVLREAARLEELVSDMVDLARPRRAEMQNIDAGAVVSDVVELMRHSGRASGDVTLRQSGERSLRISADPGQLRQMIWNLVRNAVQASAAGGEVRIHLEKGKVARLSVSDDGVGIDAPAMDRLFDAFFTTRSQGTGIGLAVVKRIADEHGFPLSVASDEGLGACFVVELGRPY